MPNSEIEVVERILSEISSHPFPYSEDIVWSYERDQTRDELVGDAIHMYPKLNAPARQVLLRGLARLELGWGWGTSEMLQYAVDANDVVALTLLHRNWNRHAQKEYREPHRTDYGPITFERASAIQILQKLPAEVRIKQLQEALGYNLDEVNQLVAQIAHDPEVLITLIDHPNSDIRRQAAANLLSDGNSEQALALVEGPITGRTKSAYALLASDETRLTAVLFAPDIDNLKDIVHRVDRGRLELSGANMSMLLDQCNEMSADEEIGAFVLAQTVDALHIARLTSSPNEALAIAARDKLQNLSRLALPGEYSHVPEALEIVQATQLGIQGP